MSVLGLHTLICVTNKERQRTSTSTKATKYGQLPLNEVTIAGPAIALSARVLSSRAQLPCTRHILQTALGL